MNIHTWYSFYLKVLYDYNSYEGSRTFICNRSKRFQLYWEDIELKTEIRKDAKSFSSKKFIESNTLLFKYGTHIRIGFLEHCVKKYRELYKIKLKLYRSIIKEQSYIVIDKHGNQFSSLLTDDQLIKGWEILNNHQLVPFGTETKLFSLDKPKVKVKKLDNGKYLVLPHK